MHVHTFICLLTVRWLLTFKDRMWFVHCCCIDGDAHIYAHPCLFVCSDDFDDFCSRASSLANESNGAPLFTVTKSRNTPRTSNQCGIDETREDDSYDIVHSSNDDTHEDEWQLLWWWIDVTCVGIQNVNLLILMLISWLL